VGVLDNQHDRSLLTEPVEEAKDQLKQPGLGILADWLGQPP
jgi:hypothetical protein